eukprot:TRINITY_DN67436_c4_g2_i1.p1 TRINITY_DN67436_c4_g2~~TRINITY_DN67436_c4_g2_i1.p1  ORF type:complete len:135 (+),score=12.14 TRINITY_DN67436_c4_g2_i1:266-670(+)
METLRRITKAECSLRRETDPMFGPQVSLRVCTLRDGKHKSSSINPFLMTVLLSNLVSSSVGKVVLIAGLRHLPFPLRILHGRSGASRRCPTGWMSCGFGFNNKALNTVASAIKNGAWQHTTLHQHHRTVQLPFG